MFAKANWAVSKFDVSSLPEFKENLSNPNVMFPASQLWAAVSTRTKLGDFSGINPFGEPRKDEEIKNPDTLASLLSIVVDYPSSEDHHRIATGKDLITHPGFGYSEAEFQITSAFPLYGLWFVHNEWKDIEDESSKRENIAYQTLEKPFKLTNSAQKKDITAEVKANAVMSRKQFPVIIDFVTGLVFFANTNKGLIYEAQSLLEGIGIKFISTAWNFGENSNWPGEFLNRSYNATHYAAEFQRYAEESKAFNKEELAEGASEDPIMQKILSNFFSSSEFDNELWVGLSSPAQIRLTPATPSVGVNSVANATLVLGTGDTTSISSAKVVLQEVRITTNKKGEEKVYRNDILSLTISDEMNLVEVGVALLPGFDLPSFRKGMKKDRSLTSVDGYWVRWLSTMNQAILQFVETVSLVLEVPQKESGLQSFLSSEEETTPKNQVTEVDMVDISE